MQDQINKILDRLSSTTQVDILEGLEALESFLRSLAPSIRKYHRYKTIDTSLASLIAFQNNFQHNIVNGLLSAYAYFAKSPSDVENDVLIKANYLLSGMLLIHPESRSLFGNGRSMALMLSFLDPNASPYSEILSVSFVSLLIHVLIKNVKNMRSFEANNGCQILIHLLSVTPTNGENTSGHESINPKILHFKVIEFLIFYFADESELLTLPHNIGVRSMSVREKADLFRPKFPGIDDLIESLSDLTSLGLTPSEV